MMNLQNINLENSRTEKGLIYNDGELGLINDFCGIYHLQPFQLEIFVVVLVNKGKATIRINGTLYENHKDDLLVCTPNNIIDSALLSPDFEGISICVSSSYLKRIYPMVENSWNLKFLLEKNPKSTLSPEEASIFRRYFDLLSLKALQTSSFRKKAMDALMVAFIYDMQDIQSRLVRQLACPVTAGELLFGNFIKLLESSNPKRHPVAYYADRLCVTPKYLSSVCSQISGQRPSTIINNYVLKDVDYLMKHTQLSIKEIANELDYPNLSFFAKYIRKHCGMSPRAYRDTIVKEALRLAPR